MENTFERYASTIEQGYITPQYVVDIEGNLHDLSGNIKSKLDIVERSWRYWEEKLVESPEDGLANRFCNKFKHLYNQINLFLENTDLVGRKISRKHRRQNG